MAFTQAADWTFGSYVTNGTSFIGSMPASSSVGDRGVLILLLEEFGGRDTTTVVTIPTGWTAWRDDQAAAGDGERLVLVGKILAGGDSFTFTTADAANGGVYGHWIRDSGGQVDLDVAGATNGTFGDTRSAPGITVTAGSRTFGLWQNGDGLGANNSTDVPTGWDYFSGISNEFGGIGWEDGLSGATGDLSPSGDPMSGSTAHVSIIWAVKVTSTGVTAALGIAIEPVSMALVGNMDAEGTLVTAIENVVMSLAANAGYTGTLGLTIEAVQINLAALQNILGTLGLTIENVVMALSGNQGTLGTLGMTLEEVVMALAADQIILGTMQIELTPVSMALSGNMDAEGTLATVLVPVAISLAALMAAVELLSQPGNRVLAVRRRPVIPVNSLIGIRPARGRIVRPVDE